jgi:rhodanese-related sulfurtransferase
LSNFRKFIVAYLAVLLASVVVASFYVQSQQKSYGDVTVEQSKSLIEQNIRLKIVDVRLDTEFNSSHIPGAINVCACDPDNMLRELNPNDEILVYCRSGLRSAAAMKFLNENGFSKVYNLVGGIVAWENAGYAVVNG